MVTDITNGVKVSVRTSYQPRYSYPENSSYYFSYTITIENLSVYTVQLLRRHWFIYDSNSTIRQVEGEGVVGLQPILNPGDLYEYTSGCNLSTEIGKMWGTYLVQRQADGEHFLVNIPAFTLIATHRLN
ncbi:MAG: Co2+/Mg2+ efflux protein ApaG [Cytophagaceae bacterium]|nr:Co2+/Mg2+ efflux protein ApaG [Cytophagaceae bacterium]MDW8456268.1 Co2+/Mg2+ efflux protein ApaG [Cytophagaceae bacterium]